MPIELSKSQRKIARELIREALQIECARFIEETEVRIAERKREGKSPHEIYLELYEKTRSFDKHIAFRYGNVSGSKYVIILLGIFYDKVLTEEDLNRFDEDVREQFLNRLKL